VVTDAVRVTVTEPNQWIAVLGDQVVAKPRPAREYG
jgi:hypothetical protein